MAAAAIFNHGMTAAQGLRGGTVAPMDNSTTGTNGTGNSGGTSGDSATISANDFLTLLVTEMQNQDPTADTDPNEYINQLVQVNSLEQLISINQTLTTDSSGSSNTSGSGSNDSRQVVSAAGTANAVAADRMVPSVQGASPDSAVRQFVSGNLTVPATNPAADRVGQALAGRN